MYKLIHHPILLPHQTSILKAFFASPLTQTFFLTGGTALAAFYFDHRTSHDFDLFSLDDFPMPQIRDLMQSIGQTFGATLSIKITTNTYQEMYLTHPQAGWTQRIDIVHEIPRHFGEIQTIDTIHIDSLENIGSNKVLTLLGRLEPKDYVDFYTIMTKTKLTFDELFTLAKQKDTGLHEFYFANSIGSIDAIKSWPEMKIPFDRQKMIDYYHRLAQDLLLRIKPE